MATKKKAPVKKIKAKKVTNGHSKTTMNIEEAETLRVFPVSHPDAERFRAIDENLRQNGPSAREITNQLAGEVAEFRDAMVKKYRSYHGRDLRRNVAWYMEQYGLAILSEMEKEKLKERQKIIAENRAKEAADKAAEKIISTSDLTNGEQSVKS